MYAFFIERINIVSNLLNGYSIIISKIFKLEKNLWFVQLSLLSKKNQKLIIIFE